MSDTANEGSLSHPLLQPSLTHAFSESISQRQLFSCLVITVCALVLLVHMPALSRQALMYDDQMYVTENPFVQNPSWESARRVFAEVWKPSTVLGYYHPLATVSLMVDRFLAGPYENMRTYHRTNLTLHVANTALVAIFLYLLFPHPFVAAAVALLFGLHPITVDSVCWLSERKTVLSSFFALWALVAYVRFTHHREARFHVTCVAAYILALLSKPIALPLPFMMLLLDYWPLNRLHWRSVAEKLPLFGVAGVFTVIGCVSQLRASHMSLPGQYNPLEVPLILSHNLIFYLSKVLWPAHLSPHYEPFNYLAISSPTMIVSIAAIFAIILLLGLSLWWTRAIFVSCLTAFVMLFPASGIVSHTIVLVANRYLYLPVIGLLPLLVWAFARFSRAHRETGVLRRSLGVAVVVVFLAGAEAVATRQYLRHWSDSATLYGYMLSLFPNSSVLHNDMGIALSSEGKPEQTLLHFRSAVRANPLSFHAHYNLALTLDNLGGPKPEVVRHYQRALWINRSYVTAHVNLGLLLLRSGSCPEALASLQKAVAIAPTYVLARYNFGRMLVVADRTEEGLGHLRQATAVDPRFLLAWKDLAWFLATHPDSQIRDPKAAVEAAEQARKMTRDRDAGVLDTLAAAYASGGQYRKAVETAQKALAMATRLGASELAGQIEDRLRLYENECPYYENPRVQLDRLIAEAKKKDQAGDRRPETGGGFNPQLTIDNRQLDTENRRLEVQDGAEAILAE